MIDMHRIEYSEQSLEDMRDLSDTITHTYDDDTVYIHRVIASSMITEP
ncbi:hypothetical protein FACS1894160_4890 [Bacteroidia bacterium]|nr:hypothetical protein FACS1894160_4890 [Bacteroidia bacterium]